MAEKLPITSLASSSVAAAGDVSFEDDACSICLEPFGTDDPATVTKCKHEYHLQCILEWSQRSKECPICWQDLFLKDPGCQELLTAVENERNLRTKSDPRQIPEDYESHHDASYADDTDLDERILRHFAAAARRARYFNRRGKQRSSGVGPSQVFADPVANLPGAQQIHTMSPEEYQISGYDSFRPLGVDSSISGARTTLDDQTPSSMVNVVPHSTNSRDGNIKPSVIQNVLPPDDPQRSSSSELLAFSESIKSRFSTASAKYKESISKSTRGFKEKLLARNISVKELGRGVQREMNAGIAGFARMIERLDLAAKRTGDPVSSSTCVGGTSNISSEGKGMPESVIVPSFNGNTGEAARDSISVATLLSPVPSHSS